ncbi:hypothetical protein BH11ACT3_BH11ACT3_11320 [soil metagenome]
MAKQPVPAPAATPGQRIAIIALSTVLGGVIAMGCVFGSAMIEPGLTSAAQSALVDAGVAGVNVRFEGREAFLSGVEASPAVLARAQTVVEQVDGVRWATVEPDGGGPIVTSTPSPSPTPTPTPTPTAVLPTEEEQAYLTSTNIYFEADSVALTPQATATLEQIAAILIRYDALGVEVTGHIAIPVGTEADAIAFSERRAQAAVDYLASVGVDPASMTILGVGTADAIGDNGTPDGAASNRRVNFTIKGGN